MIIQRVMLESLARYFVGWIGSNVQCFFKNQQEEKMSKLQFFEDKYIKTI